MAIRYDRDNNDFTHVGVPFNYTRGNPIPLDNSSVWTSKEAAETYAKTSSVAYVGQVLTIAGSTDLAATVWIIADTDGNLVQIGKRENVYSKLTMLRNYLFEIDYTVDFDYDEALKYFDRVKPVAGAGACTSIRKGTLVARNFDWTYNKMAQFIIRMHKTGNRHASIAMGGNVKALTNTVVKSGAFSPFYSLVPFITFDGVNDAGVFVSSHVVPSGDYGKTTGTKPSASQTLCNYMIPRYVLDNCDSALDAIEKLQNDVNIYCAVKDEAGNTEECAYFIADRTRSYVVEFINNAVVVENISGRPWEANFYRHGTETLNNKMHYTESGLTDHAMGVERWNIVADRYDSLSNDASMMQLLSELTYTHSYTNETDIWYSEYVEGDLKVSDIPTHPEKFNETIATWKEKFENRSRDESNPNFGTWQSCHSIVYDLDKKSIWVVPQERDVNDDSYFRALDTATVSADHSHSFVECWDITCSDSTKPVNGIHLTPNAKSIDGVNYNGYYDQTSGIFLYYNDGAWILDAPFEYGGQAVFETDRNVDVLVRAGWPDDNTISVLRRGESKLAGDRILTVNTGGGGGGGGTIPVGNVVFKGKVTTTSVEDGSHTSPIGIIDTTGASKTITPEAGTMVLGSFTSKNARTGEDETRTVLYVWDGTKVTIGSTIYSGTWHEYGELRKLNLLGLTQMAFAPKAKASYTPEGTVSAPDVTVDLGTSTFDNLKVSVSGESAAFTTDEVTYANGTVTAVTATQPTFTGTPAEIISDPYTPES